MLAIVWVVQIGSITRTSACITARSTFSCADAVSGNSRATSAASIRTIILSPRATTAHTLCDAQRMYTLASHTVPPSGPSKLLLHRLFRPKSPRVPDTPSLEFIFIAAAEDVSERKRVRPEERGHARDSAIIPDRLLFWALALIFRTANQ